MSTTKELIASEFTSPISEIGIVNPRSILFGPSTSYLTMRERTAMLENETRYTGPGVGTVILVGPPGVGKSTIIQALAVSGDIEIFPLLTTRQAGSGDAPSLDRIFVKPDVFAEMREKNELLAISDKSGAQGSYQMAVAKYTLRAISNVTRPFILDKTFSGWMKLLQEMACDINLDDIRNKILASHHYVFILPPDMLTLNRRLFHRNRTPNSESSKEEKREELKRGKEFEKLLDDSLVPNISYIVNNDISRVVYEIGQILRK